MARRDGLWSGVVRHGVARCGVAAASPGEARPGTDRLGMDGLDRVGQDGAWRRLGPAEHGLAYSIRISERADKQKFFHPEAFSHGTESLTESVSVDGL